jgi:acetophenone carboxylase
VALTPDGDTVDAEATKARRDAERQDRIRRGKPHAAFMAEWEQLKPPDEILTGFGKWPTGEPTMPVYRP